MESKATPINIESPVINDLTKNLSETGRYQKDLSERDVAEIMGATVNGLMSTYKDQVRAQPPVFNVKIQNEQSIFNGKVKIESPIGATLGLDLTLGVDPEKSGGLKLQNFKLDVQAGFIQKTAINALNIEGKIRDKLKDPNEALKEGLNFMLNSKGLKVGNIRAFFKTNNTLSIAVIGGKVV